ncbi:protocadherin Fat 1-like isoform X2 [Mercenaria mercenaria]|uniref:protocadherin Fat 1-like isoform X2 n=1 Tax=Mercenaria mercenaria TaxID=6596 RepID=UPI00234EE2C8|nr:protocadherin Fat 1-like isoform X2 [Mercenaria mercenaria]
MYPASEPYFTTSTYPVTVLANESTMTPGGTILHQFIAKDDEAGVVPFLDFTFDPASGVNMFDITETVTSTERNAVVSLKLNEEFNYEGQDTYKIYATASDGVNSASVLLTIQVVDIGEAPNMNPNTTSQSFIIEENAAGTVIGSPSFTIEDLDNIEVHTWAITGGNGTNYVSINANNGTITLKSDYDRDDTSNAEDIYVDVSVTDKYGLSVTTTYLISITDRNDNIPVCSPSTYNFNVTRTTAIGTVLASLTCTDADISSPNNQITYAFQTGDPMSEYFNISGSDIVSSYILDFEYGGGPYTVFVYAADGGNEPTTGTATLSFTIPEATTLPPTTTNVPNPSYDALSSDNSLTMLLITTAFIAACVSGYVLILCWRWNTFGQCLPKQCPDRSDCRKCCTCCPGDDIEKAMIVDSKVPSGFTEKKGMSLGPEAPNSRRKSPMSIFSK